jgi:tRNA uridine 5-carboxymethylaminomethyl modification enzyme
MIKAKKYEAIVVGGGHAGIEASLALSRKGHSTLLITLKKNSIGLMSCNPAIGGIGKGQLVKEIDALGGQMAKSADYAAIQFKTLNASKGPAVQSTRAQIDRQLYQKYMQDVLMNQSSLALVEQKAMSLIVEKDRIIGVRTDKETFYSDSVVLATGTFLNGVIYSGLKRYPAGRRGEAVSIKLSDSLKEIGLEIGRLKTCTPPRLDGKTIDFRRMKVQPPDSEIRPFSFLTTKVNLDQKPCYLTYTNEQTHKIIRLALKDKRLLNVVSHGVNPRYCPSVEEKIIRFPDKDRHQLFIEPEGLNSDEYYANGLFTFLPENIQEDMLTTIRGLKKAQITKAGYGIEYDFVLPTQVFASLQTKKIKNLFLAGQINGTTGYEEAAAQGLIAGINAGLKLENKEPLILDRSTSYIGVLIDDLVTKGTNEPYRMFTSRVEYRLILREDNADLRLRKIGHKVGLVSNELYKQIQEKEGKILQLEKVLKKKKIKIKDKKVSLSQYLKRPEVNIKDLKKKYDLNFPDDVLEEAEINIGYSGFIDRQHREVKKFKDLEKMRIPQSLDFDKVPSLSGEIKEKLKKFRPLNLGQANRISGITPAAISILMVYLKKIDKD